MQLKWVEEERGGDRNLVVGGRSMASYTVTVIGWSYGVYRQFLSFICHL